MKRKLTAIEKHVRSQALARLWFNVRELRKLDALIKVTRKPKDLKTLRTLRRVLVQMIESNCAWAKAHL